MAATTLPRSFMYVPATRHELFSKAAAGPADAVVLDLEDAVPVASKDDSRDGVAAWLDSRAAAGRGNRTGNEQWVRINADAIGADLDAVVRPGLDGLFLAKCSVAALAEAGSTLDRLEREREMAPGSLGLVGLVEDARGLLTLAEMARNRRLLTFGIGEVDLLGDLRITRGERSAAAVDALRAQVVVHSAGAGLQAPVAPTSTDFRDLERFRETTQHMFDLGFRSRTAIHPGQLDVIHQVFTPGPEELARAQDVMDRFAAAHDGITTDDEGRLIDAAVVRAARETLSRRREG